jgi:hypothetical protein
MVFSPLSLLSSDSSNEERVHRVIESMVGQHIVSIVDEAKKYCYKCFDGTIGTIDRDFVHDIAGV